MVWPRTILNSVSGSISTQISTRALCLNDQAYNCLILLRDNCTVTVNLWRKTTFDRRQPLTEDDFWRKTTFDERRPLTEYDLWRKTTFDGRRPLKEDEIWGKTTFGGRQSLTEDDLWQKTIFDGRRPLTEDDLWRKTTFDRRRPLMEKEYITWKKCLWLLTLTVTAQLTPNRKFYQLS